MLPINNHPKKKFIIAIFTFVIIVLSLHAIILWSLLFIKMPTIQPKKTQKPIKINLVAINNKPIKKPIKRPTPKTIKKSITKPKIKNSLKPKLSVKKPKTAQKKLTQPIKTEKQKIIVKKKPSLKKQTVKKAMPQKEIPQVKKVIKVEKNAKTQPQISQVSKKVIAKNNPQKQVQTEIKQNDKINKLAKNTAKINNNFSEKQTQSPIIKEKINSKKTDNKNKNIANKPYNFSNSEIQWKKQPILTLPNKITDRIRQKKTYTVTVKAKVDSKGNIISLKKIKSCGNGRIDKQALKSAKQAKFIPFKRNGVSVSGNVIFSLIYHL
ncbi:MAG: TonB family protein [Moraxellaceae bacterium]|nr:TonB family protein [Moraxellaceae bacterium]